MTDLIDQPRVFHQAAEFLVVNALVFAKAQAAAGADIIGIGDARPAWSGRRSTSSTCWDGRSG